MKQIFVNWPKESNLKIFHVTFFFPFVVASHRVAPITIVKPGHLQTDNSLSL